MATYTFPDDKRLINLDTVIDAEWIDDGRLMLVTNGIDRRDGEIVPRIITLTGEDAQLVWACLQGAQMQVLAALRKLVHADNTGYTREAMRYEKLFDNARAALVAATGLPI